MYIRTNETNYPCVGYGANETMAVFQLADDAPETLGETVELYQDDGFLLAGHTVADYLRWEASAGALILTNAPVVEAEETPAPEVEPEPDIRQLRADVDYLAAMQGVTL